jgi:hypothetical protein
MAQPNQNYSDIMATTIDSRSRKIADNVTGNNALLARLKQKGKIKTFSGGVKILQELSFSENSNGGWYAGYDILPVGVSEVITTAEYGIKQAAVPVIISGLEMLQNAGRERMIDLMDARLSVAESTLANLISQGIYSNGSLANNKQIDGLEAAVPVDPTTAVSYGGIPQNTYAWWRNKTSNQTAATTAGGGRSPTSIQGFWNELWASIVRGVDRPDLIACDNIIWGVYMASLQTIQRFSSPEMGNLGFVSSKFMDADVVLDGGIGGDAFTGTAYFLNTNYLHFRPHAQRNMTALSPNKRYATNQDAEVQILAWAGNLTCSGRQFQGRYDAN